jgi:hypothetical protein
VNRRYGYPFTNCTHCGGGRRATHSRRGEFRTQTDRVEKLAAKLDLADDPEVRAAALELVRSVIELHEAAPQRMIDRCLESAEGERILNVALQDDLVASMFSAPFASSRRHSDESSPGVEAVRPYLKSHRGDCKLAEFAVFRSGGPASKLPKNG